jgi:imidazolonepropionase
MTKPVWIRRASQLVTLAGGSGAPVTGEQMNELSIIENGSVWLENGRIERVGTDEELESAHRHRTAEAEVIDASGRLVTPGLIDPHTHLVHAGTRQNEFNMRLNGATYMEIMNNGGGIHSTTAATRNASHDQLFAESKKRLDLFLLHGVTTIEAKSGYGLTLEDEIKQLEVAKTLDAQHAVDLVSTFMPFPKSIGKSRMPSSIW